MIIQEARERAQSEYDKILAQAGKDAEKKQKDAEKVIAMEREKAMEDLKLSAAGLAMTAAARLLAQQGGPGEDQKRYQEFLAKAAESGDGHD